MRLLSTRPSRQLVDFAQYNFTGLNIQDAPESLADGELTEATNVYLHLKGALAARYGLVPFTPTAPLPPGGGLGMVSFVQNVVGGVANTRGFVLVQIGSTLCNALTGEVYGSIGAATAMSTCKVFDPSNNSGTDLLIICTGIGGPYCFDGTTVSTFTTGPVDVTGARWCYSIGPVLWFAGLPEQANLVAGSAVGTPEVEPGYATFTFSTATTGLSALGVGLQATLAVGLEQGVGLVSGFTPNSYIEQEIPNSDGDGVASGLSMSNIDGYLFFAGRETNYRYDGTNFANVGRRIQTWLQGNFADFAIPQFPLFPGSWNQIWTLQRDRRLYFWFNPQNPITAPLYSQAYVWDIDQQGWTVYNAPSTGGLGGGCTLPVETTAQSGYQGGTTMLCDYASGQIYVMDMPEPGSEVASDNGAVIPASITTKYFKIGEPGVSKRVLRSRNEAFLIPPAAVSVGVIPDVDASKMVTGTPPSGLLSKVVATNPPSTKYVKFRNDFNVQGEAFAFQFGTPVDQPTPTAPWRFVGFSGRVALSARG